MHLLHSSLKYFKIVLLYALVSIVFIAFIVIGNAIYSSLASSDSSEDMSYDTSNCNILGIDLHGDILTYIPGSSEDDRLDIGDAIASEDVVHLIRRGEVDENIKGIMMDIDSYGGYLVAGEEIADALKQVTKPTVAVMRQNGLSAAYWAATGADTIFASKNSEVGSIGVTSSYLGNTEKNRKDGLEYIQLSTGKFKDAGNPDKPLTEEERKLFIRDLTIMHENFIEAVSENRNIPIETVRALADGSSVLGKRAQELGLVDEIGGWFEAEKHLEERIKEKPEICWF